MKVVFRAVLVLERGRLSVESATAGIAGEQIGERMEIERSFAAQVKAGEASEPPPPPANGQGPPGPPPGNGTSPELTASLGMLGVIGNDAAGLVLRFGEKRVAGVVSWVLGRMKKETVHDPAKLLLVTLERNPT